MRRYSLKKKADHIMSIHSPLLEHAQFSADFAQLQQVTLNPARHTAANAYEHSLLVARRAQALAAANGCTEAQTSTLRDLGLVHDIGKAQGTTSPSKSVEMLPRYQLTDPAFVELVRYHDINLAWFTSFGKGEAPTDKAWHKMARRVDMYLLGLFMVADRVDCPGGWRENAALVWFLDEAERRGMIPYAQQRDIQEAEQTGGRNG
jgi:HD domain